MDDKSQTTEGMDLAKLRRVAAKIREDALRMGPYGFSKAAVLSIVAIIEECTPAEPKPEGRKRLSELRVVVDYNLPADEVRVSPCAFSQLQMGLLEVDTFRGL